jgi:glycosyltransferase involved in cell wall biosynthesis
MLNDSEEPLVSVIMNCYNCEAFLSEAIESVLNQTYKNFEIIFWDNNSTDNSSIIYNRYQNRDNRLKYFLSNTNTMLGEARNLAIEKASGEWIAFLDCDDIWLPEKIEKQIKLFNITNNPNVNLIYGQSLIFNDSRVVSNSEWFKKSLKYKDKFLLKKLPEGQIFDKLIFVNFIPLLTAIVKKSSIEKVGKINTEYNLAEDYELFLKISLTGEALALNEIISLYRVHNLNTSIIKQEERYLEVFKIVGFYKNLSIYQKAIKFHKVVFAISLYRNKRIIQSLILLIRYFSLYSAWKLIMLKYFKKI